MDSNSGKVETSNDMGEVKTDSNEFKFVIVGNIGSGKTTSIEAVSEIPVIGTEARAREQETSHSKSTTTVAMEYGILQIQRIKIHLYGTPGDRRFDFMATILSKGAAGMIIMIDNSHNSPLDELDYFLKLHGKFLKEYPAILAITHFDSAGTRNGLTDYYSYAAEKGFIIPVMRLDAREPKAVRNMLMKLLIEIIKRRAIRPE